MRGETPFFAEFHETGKKWGLTPLTENARAFADE
jgi:hypothetical protein